MTERLEPVFDFTVTELAGSDEWQTERPGFNVGIYLHESAENLGNAELFDGYALAIRGGREVIEDDVLHVQMVQTAQRETIHGIGKSLTRAALLEGAERGFEQTRADVIHPRMLSVLGALARENVLHEMKLFRTTPSRMTSEELMAHAVQIEFDEAQRYLNSHSNPLQFQGSAPKFPVHALFNIAQQS